MVEVAFYIAKRGKLYDRVVSFLTHSKFSHVELCADNICYSSSNRDGGVRSKVINLSNKKWLLIQIDSDANKIYEYYEMTKNSKYDYLSVIFNLIFKWNIDLLKNRFHCFEWVISALNYANDTKLNVNMSINEFYTIVKKLECQND